jgi:translation initiation factor 1
MGKQKNRIDTSGPSTSSHNPFRALRDAAQSADAEAMALPTNEPAPASTDDSPRDRGRVNIVRQTARRGGKAVILITDFVDTSEQEKSALLRTLRKACGTGGTVKNGNIEIQGEKREEVKRILEEAGYRAVFAGG